MCALYLPTRSRNASDERDQTARAIVVASRVFPGERAHCAICMYTCAPSDLSIIRGACAHTHAIKGQAPSPKCNANEPTSDATTSTECSHARAMISLIVLLLLLLLITARCHQAPCELPFSARHPTREQVRSNSRTFTRSSDDDDSTTHWCIGSCYIALRPYVKCVPACRGCKAWSVEWTRRHGPRTSRSRSVPKYGWGGIRAASNAHIIDATAMDGMGAGARAVPGTSA